MQQIRRAYMVLVFIGFSVSILFAQTEYAYEERESLRGLTGVFVSVEEPSKALSNAGITKKILETDVEVKLRVAGIRVLLRDELCSQGLLVVMAKGFKVPKGYAFNVTTELYQAVYLSRQPSTKVPAITWNESIIVISPKFNDVRETLRDQIDVFVNDFLAVNPK